MKILDLIHTYTFPTVIAHCINKDLALRLFPYAENIIKTFNNKENYFNYSNTYGVALPDNTLKSELVSFISDVTYAYWASMGVEDKINDISVFYSEMNEGGSHAKHVHPDSKLAGVFYLNAPENSAEIRFYDPRPHSSFFRYKYIKHPSLLYQIHDVVPYTGLFLIFPAWLTHEVLKNKTDNKRTTAVFNIT